MAAVVPTSVGRCHRFVQFIKNFNIYNHDDELNLVNQILSTRCYIAGLVISIFIILSFTGIYPKPYTVTISSPSVRDFENFVASYKFTPTCRCSQVSIIYEQFLVFNPQFHQVCSSDFITESWISSLFNETTSNYYPLDFRLTASAQFQVLATLCATSYHTVSDALKTFLFSLLISTNALSRVDLDTYIATFVDQFKATTIADFQLHDQFVTSAVEQNRFVSALRTNFYTSSVPGSGAYEIYSGIYPTGMNLTHLLSMTNETCRCDQTSDCIYPASIYNQSRAIVPGEVFSLDAFVLFTVPGFQVGCVAQNAMLQSTMECFFNQSCIDALILLAGGLRTVSPLSIAAPLSRFHPTTTIGTIFNNLMIESWQNTSDFAAYFQACAPKVCTYSYTKRFVFINMVTTLIGLFGGLSVTFRVISPFIAKFLSHKCCRTTQLIERVQIQGPTLGFRNRLWNFLTLTRHKIMTFNLFKRNLTDVQRSIYSTRVYSILLISGFIILVTYTSYTPDSQVITVRNPTVDQLEELYSLYPSVVSCPCQQVSMPHSAFMSTEVRFHPFCTSIFVRDDSWLQYWPMKFLNGSVDYAPPFPQLDFRHSGYKFLKWMQLLCDMASATVNNQLDIFQAEHFFSSQPITRLEFNELTSDWQNLTQAQISVKFPTTYLVVSRTIRQSYVLTLDSMDLIPTARQLNDTWILYYIEAAYNLGSYDYCVCDWMTGCNQPIGFSCYSPPCVESDSLPLETVPGLYLGCFLFDFVYSTLECFYNQSCIQMLIDSRLVDYENVYLEVDLGNTTALYPNATVSSTPQTLIYFLLSQVFIDQWIGTADYASYYAQCHPETCTYIIKRKMHPIAIVTSIAGLLGGLSVLLRLVVPPMVHVIQYIYRFFYRRTRNTIVQRSCIAYVRENLLAINVYQSKADVNHQLGATRIYLVLLILSFIIVSLFTRFEHHIVQISVDSVNETYFEVLQTNYLDTLSCPCSRISIGYDHLIAISFQLHEICSQIPAGIDFSISTIASQFLTDANAAIIKAQIITLFYICGYVDEATKQIQTNLYLNSLVTIETISQRAFNALFNRTIAGLAQSRLDEANHFHTSILDMFQANQFQNRYMTTWKTEFSSLDENFVLRTRPVSFGNGTAFCAASISNFTRPLVVHDLDGNPITFTGLVGGCSLISGVYQSTLECFYDEICLDQFYIVLNFRFEKFNISATRFLPTTRFGSILDEYLIESWGYSTNYSNYFRLCSPSKCQYTYTEQNSAIYVFTALLGLYGGLTAGMKIFVWYVLRLYRLAIHRCFQQAGRIFPSPSTRML